MSKRFFKTLLTLFLMTALASTALEAKERVLTKLVNGVNVFDSSSVGDMSGFNPGDEIDPGGDVIKIAIIAPFSGPGSLYGEAWNLVVNWVAYDINQRGGLFVDGKHKKIKVYKANNQSNPTVLKKVVEQMILREKVDILWGTNGSNFAKIVNQLANKYKVIFHNNIALSGEVMEGRDFTPYAFMTCYTTGQIGRALAYYYGKIRKKEKKFYILGQDYSFGHTLSEGFRSGLKEFYPEAELVGNDFHRPLLTDYAPYISKIKNSGAEVVYSGDWAPDITALTKQARNMGLMIPFARVFGDDPALVKELGYKGILDSTIVTPYGFDGPLFKDPGYTKLYETWHKLWKTKWKKPYNSITYEHMIEGYVGQIEQTYWLFSVIERAGTTKAKKIIKTWEGDKYQFANGKVVEMRPCDHKTIQPLHVWAYSTPEEQKKFYNKPPYYLYKDTPAMGMHHKIPADAILPVMNQKRCKK